MASTKAKNKAKKGGKSKTTIWDFFSKKQEEKTKREELQQAGKSTRAASRAAGKVGKAEAKAAGGYYTEGSTSARWEGITGTAAIGGQLAGSAAAAYLTGGASLAAGGLAESLGGMVEGFGSMGGASSEEAPPAAGPVEEMSLGDRLVAFIQDNPMVVVGIAVLIGAALWAWSSRGRKAA